VRGAAGINILPLSGNYSCDGLRLPDQPVPRGQEPCAEARSVSPGYFRVMRIPLLRGRMFDEHDDERGRKVVMVNEAMAQRFWRNQDPIGRHVIYFSRGDDDPREIVGVVGDTKHLALTDAAPPQFYTPQRQSPSYHAMTLVVRATQDPAMLAGTAREELRGLDAQIPIYNVQTLDEVLVRIIATPRLHALLLSAFALFAVLLASVGIYGVVAWVVTQQTREIGVRVALGATRRDILSLVVRQGMAPVAAGLAIGIACAALLARSLQGLLFGVAPSDPAAFVGTFATVALVALIACYLPARRAMRLDPVSALRAE
jgi:putative ABC transport system permease protein